MGSRPGQRSGRPPPSIRAEIASIDQMEELGTTTIDGRQLTVYSTPIDIDFGFVGNVLVDWSTAQLDFAVDPDGQPVAFQLVVPSGAVPIILVQFTVSKFGEALAVEAPTAWSTFEAVEAVRSRSGIHRAGSQASTRRASPFWRPIEAVSMIVFHVRPISRSTAGSRKDPDVRRPLEGHAGQRDGRVPDVDAKREDGPDGVARREGWQGDVLHQRGPGCRGCRLRPSVGWARLARRLKTSQRSRSFVRTFALR